MKPDSLIFVAGHRGMVGSALVRTLRAAGYHNLLLRTRSELNLRDGNAVMAFFQAEKPDVVIDAAAKVGGIHSNNTYPADFIYDNLAIQLSLIEAARHSGAGRFLFLGSSCIYPKHAPQPIPESALLTRPLEPTNEAYAVAKIAGLKMCEFYRKQYGVLFHSAMPTNLYGPGDNYHPTNSHVLPAMIRRFHEAKQENKETVVLWGSGKPRREFLHVDDLAAGVLHLLQLADPPDLVNIGFGSDVTIRQLAEMVCAAVGFQGQMEWDASRPDGTPRKLMDSSLVNRLGWSPKIGLQEGIARTYQEFLDEQSNLLLRAS
jgi:GDP-L-fucose synthase